MVLAGAKEGEQESIPEMYNSVNAAASESAKKHDLEVIDCWWPRAAVDPKEFFTFFLVLWRRNLRLSRTRLWRCLTTRLLE